MKSLLVRSSLLALFCMLLGTPAVAQGLKIGVLDMKLVTERSTAIQQMISRAEAPLKSQKDRIDAKFREYEQQSSALTAKRSALNEDALKAEEEKLRRLREEIEDMDTEVRRQYARLDQEVMKPAVSRILQIVTEVAKREGFELVLPTETVLYHVEKIDITPLVIQTLDREGAEGLESAAKKIRENQPGARSSAGDEKSSGERPAGGEKTSKKSSGR